MVMHRMHRCTEQCIHVVILRAVRMHFHEYPFRPAFDVNPNPDKDVHVLALDAADPTPDTQVLVAQHAFFRLDAGRAASILEEVRHAVRPWASEAKAAGANSQARSLMSAVIDPER